MWILIILKGCWVRFVLRVRRNQLLFMKFLIQKEVQLRLKKINTIDDFEKGVKLFYDHNFAEASVYFSHICEKNTEDKPALIYLKKSGQYIFKDPGPDFGFFD